MKRFISGFLFTLLSCLAMAKGFTVSGVAQSTTGNAVPFASIALSNPSDSSVVQFSVADDAGAFSFRNVDEGSYLLVAASVGFEVEYQQLSVNSDRSSIVLTMTPATMSIKEVMVVAKRIPILMHGDTVVYNSESFKTQTNANVEDLIRKMPGIKVDREGVVSVSGQNISKVLVNGKEFFGGNVEAATKNLDASMIDKVEVIDRKTDEDEFTASDDQEREKVINLVLKEDMMKGYFGRATAGYGADNLYHLHGNINFFRNEHQLSIIGGSNNINRRLYGWRDMRTLQSFDINPFNYGGRSMSFNGGVKSYDGVGLNLHTETSDVLKTDLSYIVTQTESKQISARDAQVFLTDNTLFSETDEVNNGNQNDHQVNAKMEYQPDTLNRWVLRAKYSTNSGIADRVSQQLNFLDREQILNSGVNRDNEESSNDKIAAKLHWTKKNARKPANHFLGSVYVDRAVDQNLNSAYYHTADSLLPWPSNESPLSEQFLRTEVTSLATTSAYQIELSDKWKIRPGFNYMVGKYNHVFSWRENQSEVNAKSPVGDVVAHNMEYFMRIYYKLDSVTSIFFVPELNQHVEQRSFTSDQVSEYDFNQFFFIPYMWIRSEKPKKFRARFSIRGSVIKPQINQLIPLLDDSDPYNYREGNITLQNYIRYSNNWSYTRMFGLGKYLSLSGWNNYSRNPVVLNQTVNDENYSNFNFVNHKYNITSGQYLEAGIPVQALKATVGLNANTGYSENFSIRNGKDIRSIDLSYGMGPSIQFNEFDYWSLDLEYNYTLNSGVIDGVKNNPFNGHNLDAELIITPFSRLEWSTDLYLEAYGGNTTGSAVVIPLLSSEVQFFIDKDKRWSLGIEAFDILDQNQNLWRWWTNNTYVENRSNSIRRYVMGKLTYAIKKPKSQSGDDNKGHNW